MKFIIILLALLIVQIGLLVLIIYFSCNKLCKTLDKAFYLLYGCIDNGNCSLDEIQNILTRFENDRNEKEQKELLKQKELQKDDLPWP